MWNEEEDKETPCLAQMHSDMLNVMPAQFDSQYSAAQLCLRHPNHECLGNVRYVSICSIYSLLLCISMPSQSVWNSPTGNTWNQGLTLILHWLHWWWQKWESKQPRTHCDYPKLLYFTLLYKSHYRTQRPSNQIKRALDFVNFHHGEWNPVDNFQLTNQHSVS